MRFYLILLAVSVMFAGSCRHTLPQPSGRSSTDPSYGGFPDDVGKIFHSKCVDGCHSAETKQSGLNMDTWEHLFEGGSHGASAVAYDTNYSLLLHYINTDPKRGAVSQPTMPKDATPLSIEEYNTIKSWIARGAPDRNGRIPFAENPDTRQKIYVTQQCDVVTVIDGASKLVMRYIPIGKEPTPEAPHCLRTTEDGRFAFVCFRGSRFVQKIDTRLDKVVDDIDLGFAEWDVLTPSGDGTKVMLSSIAGNRVRFVDLLTKKYNELPNFPDAHGLAALPGFEVFYITGQMGNTLYKMSPTDPFYNTQTFTLDGQPSVTSASSYDPHEVLLAPDAKALFVTCQGKNSLAVIDTSNTVLKMLPTGSFPQEMAISHKHPYLFVSCMYEPSPFATGDVLLKGAIYVYNYKTLEFVKKIEGRFMDVHGITVDDRNNTLYIFSRNFGIKGPLPHHVFGCGEKNGFFHVYDLTSFQEVQGKRELPADPYSVDVRFKN